MHTYSVTIRLPKGQHQKVTVEADTESNARKLFEMQYGRGNLIGGLSRIK